MLSVHLYHRLKLHQATQPAHRTKKNNTSEDRLSKPINLNNAAGVAYLEKVQLTYQEGVNRSDGEANTTDRDLSNQLRLITTVLITANIVVYGNRELLLSLTTVQRFLLLGGITCLGISLCIGIAYYQEVKRFHKSWANARNKIANAIVDRDVRTFYEIDKKVAEETGKLSPNIDEKLLKRQIRLLVFGLTIYFILAASLLFSFRFITKDWGWYK